MKSLSILAALLIATACPAQAIVCGKAVSTVEKLICATQPLKRADQEMGVAYVRLLRKAPDSEFHEALIRSQRRWLETRSRDMDRSGAEEDDQTDAREALLTVTRDRLKWL